MGENTGGTCIGYTLMQEVPVTLDDDARREETEGTGEEAGPSCNSDITIANDTSRNMVTYIIYTYTCTCMNS